MRHSLLIRVLPLLAGAALLLEASAHGQTTRVEAETSLAAGDMKVWELPDASGSKAVSIARDWQPLLIADVPPTGNEFSVWVRYKDKPVLVKADVDGQQKDLSWLWDSPDRLTWKKVGRYPRAQLGKQLIVIRGGNGGQGAVLDAVIFAADDAYIPDDGATTIPGVVEHPDGQLFEAEANTPAQVVKAEGASGGLAVRSDNDWQSLVEVPLPPGDAFKVWVRHKGGPFAIKTSAGDRWFWDKPEKWTWAETDVFSRAELGGQKMTLERDAGGAKADGVLVDAVVLTPAQKRELPSEQGNPAAPPQAIRPRIEWQTSVGTLSPLHWGINEQQILEASGSADPVYQKRMIQLGAPLIRIHQGDLVEKWTNPQTRDWDVEKIKTGFGNATRYYGAAKVMLDINTVPAWIAGGHAVQMTVAQEDEFAAFCARLVSIVRQNNFKVDYWELTNEWDNTFEGAGQLPKLWRIYNKCAAAIRKIAPDTKIGGPALTWSKPEWIEGFLDNCPDADFLSWHTYGTGDVYEQNDALFASASKNYGGAAGNVQSALQKRGRHMETFLTETNVKYSWDPYERRHQNSVGAIFDAIVVETMAQSKVTGTMLWAQKGQAYGSLVGSDNVTFPAYTLYGWGRRFLVGAMAQVKNEFPDELEVLAVTRADGHRSVLLCNKTEHALVLPAATTLLPGVKTGQQITSPNTLNVIAASQNPLTIAPFSLTLLTDSPSVPGPVTR